MGSAPSMRILHGILSPDEFARRVPNLFFIVGLVFGVGYVSLVPRLRVPDESSHFFRAYTVSNGHCIGPPAILAPVDWREMETKQIWIELPYNTTPQGMVALMHAPQNRSYGMVGAFAVGNVYNCISYLPGAAGVAVAKLFYRSPLIWMEAGRLTNLLSYLLLIRLALQLLPGFHLLMAATALMPMALHQAGSLSADNPAIALSCLFIAYVLRLAFADRCSVLTQRQLVTLAIFVVALFLCKTLLYLVLLVILVPSPRFVTARRKWLWMFACVLLAVSVSFGWQFVNHLNMERVTAIRADYGILMPANFQYALSHPFDFVGRIGSTIVAMKYEYTEEFVGKLGWLSVRLPEWLIWTYLGMLALITAGCQRHAKLTSGPRILLACLWFMNAVSAFLVVWTFETPTTQIASGSSMIYGVQGRYFIPFAFPMFVSISGSWPRVGVRWLRLIAFGVILMANSVALYSVWETYDSRTSTIANRERAVLNRLLSPILKNGASEVSKYEGKLVRRPGPTVEDGKVYVVLKGERRWIVFGDWIRAHGFNWPDDVIVISAGELEKIFLGEPIVEKK